MKPRHFNIVTIVLLVLSGCRYAGERPYVTYASVHEAEEDRAFRRGWLPNWLPEDAYNIHEYHDLDTNIRAFSFQLRKTPFVWPKNCMPSRNPPRPKIKTKLMPDETNLLASVNECGAVFVVKENNNTVHAWSN
jgi:hypothetical protein